MIKVLGGLEGLTNKERPSCVEKKVKKEQRVAVISYAPLSFIAPFSTNLTKADNILYQSIYNEHVGLLQVTEMKGTT